MMQRARLNELTVQLQNKFSLDDVVAFIALCGRFL